MDFINAQGMESFLEKEAAKWRCPECGGGICWHNGLSFRCNLVESLSQLGFAANDPDIQKGLQWFCEHIKEDGLWDLAYGGKEIPRSRNYVLDREWLRLRTCRMLQQFLTMAAPGDLPAPYVRCCPLLPSK